MFACLRRVGAGCLAIALVLAAGGCRPSGRTAITLAGSTAFQPFAEKLADQYMAAHPEVAITVQGGGSFVGIQSALAGTAHLGMADLVDLPAEASNLTATVVARDGIAVVVHPSNGLADLTLDQVRDLFSGKIRNWIGVGGADRPVTVVSREAGSGTRSSFEQILKGLIMSPNALVQDSNGSVRETVANDPQAVGYLSHGLLNDRIRAVTVNGKPCTTEAVVKGEYVLARPVFLLTRGAPEGAVKAFLDYILSPEGQKTIADSGLIPAALNP